ncbi:MAG: hypothetical protein AAF933_03395 [Pseudomonadota bacterium]
MNDDGCGPSERDTDNDGVNDASDAFPNDPTETVDSDSDGLGDNLEVQLGSNPNLTDSDGDGFLDKEELDSGTDPTDGGDFPTTLPVWLMAAPRPNEWRVSTTVLEGQLLKVPQEALCAERTACRVFSQRSV